MGRAKQVIDSVSLVAPSQAPGNLRSQLYVRKYIKLYPPFVEVFDHLRYKIGIELNADL